MAVHTKGLEVHEDATPVHDTDVPKELRTAVINSELALRATTARRHTSNRCTQGQEVQAALGPICLTGGTGEIWACSAACPNQHAATSSIQKSNYKLWTQFVPVLLLSSSVRALLLRLCFV